MAKRRRLLVAGIAGDRERAAKQMRRCHADLFARRGYLRQNLARHVEDLQQLLVPVQRLQVEEQRARCVADIGGMHRAVREIPDQPRIDRAEREFAALRAPAGTAHVVEQPGDLGAGKIRIEQQSGLGRDIRLDAKRA